MDSKLQGKPGALQTRPHPVAAAGPPPRAPHPKGRAMSASAGHSPAAPPQPLPRPQTSVPPSHPRPVRVAPKYPKICPAIAPKPMAVAAMPKMPFSPTISKPAGLLLDLLALLLNTLKRWVLPPRPRPGRKPTGTDEKPQPKMLPKKRAKVVKKEPEDDANILLLALLKLLATTTAATSASSLASVSRKLSVATTPATPDTASDTATTKITTTNSTKAAVKPAPEPSSKEIAELKQHYLSKLKEQELIRNYIEVITNQITELSFVKLGMITFEALRPPTPASAQTLKATPVMTTTALLTLPSLTNKQHADQLDQINSIQDLNKFLAYLNRLLLILNLATKRQPLKREELELWVNHQINHYLELRAKFKPKQGAIDAKLLLLRLLSSPFAAVLAVELPALKPLALMRQMLVALLPRFLDDFDFDMGRPLSDIDLVLDNDVVDRMILETALGPSISDIPNEIGILMADDDYGVKIHLGSSKDDDLSAANDNGTRLVTSLTPKRQGKFNCGFCSLDTPCLCLDTDIETCVPK